MAKYVVIEGKPYMELDITDCEILLNCIIPKRKGLEQMVTLNRNLLEEGILSERNKKKLAKQESHLNAINILFDIIVSIGNHIN